MEANLKEEHHLNNRGKSRLELMRKQFIKKQANRPNVHTNTSPNNSPPKITSNSRNTHHKNKLPTLAFTTTDSSSSNNVNNSECSVESSSPSEQFNGLNIKDKVKSQSCSTSTSTSTQYTGISSSGKSVENSDSSENTTILDTLRKRGPVVAKDVRSSNSPEKSDSSQSPKTNLHRGSRLLHKGNKNVSRSKRMSSPIQKQNMRHRNPSPKGRTPSPHTRPPSPNTDGISPYSPEVTQKKIDRVMKARLYLLQQNGPNSFRVGGDSPDHKYRVIVGPQNCNCGRGIFCVHVLFVMLRVFQLPPTSPLLWRKKLKNFEVESLFQEYRERCKSRIQQKMRKSHVKRMVTQMSQGSDQVDSNISDDQGSSKSEEDNCPICLLPMEEEALTICKVGCRNKLHTHCVDIWAEECRRSGDALKCPLCRVVWKPAEVRRGMFPMDIPLEYEDAAPAWIRIFGVELVSCLFSSNSNWRENGLRRLSHDITGALLTYHPLDGADVHSVDSDRSTPPTANSDWISNNESLSTCCEILAMVCADTDYRVYITALRTLRAMLAYTNCQNESDVVNFQKILSPVINTILIKCADVNRRTLQLSVSTIMELCRGQNGELAVGKELSKEESVAVSDIPYILSFLTTDRSTTVSWQWLLGRLNVVNELYKEFKEYFANPEKEIDSSNLMKVIQFATYCLKSSTHQNVTKMAQKVFLQTANLIGSEGHLISECRKYLGMLDYEGLSRLHRRVEHILDDKAARQVDNQIAGTFITFSRHADILVPQYATSLDALSSDDGSPPPIPPRDPDIEKELSDFEHTKKPDCFTSHPPTPPPNSIDTTDLNAAIEVSLFRPIPWTPFSETDSDSDCDTTTVYSVDKPPELPPGKPQKFEAIPSFIMPDTRSEGDSEQFRSYSNTSTPLDTPSSLTSSKFISRSEPSTPGSPDKRPNLLRLRPEFSAFKQAGLPHHLSAGDSQSQQSKRMTVRELASNIEKKNTPWVLSSAHSNAKLPSRKSAPVAISHVVPDLPKNPKPPVGKKPENILTKPVALPARLDTQSLGRSVARKGTMERYRERRRIEGHTENGQNNLTIIGEVESSKPQPLLTPYNPATESQNGPKRGILKHADAKSTKDSEISDKSDIKSPDSAHAAVFIHENTTHEHDPIVSDAGSDSDVSIDKKFDHAKDSITDLHNKQVANASHKQPTRPKLLRKKSPTRGHQAVRQINPNKESLFYVRSIAKEKQLREKESSCSSQDTHHDAKSVDEETDDSVAETPIDFKTEIGNCGEPLTAHHSGEDTADFSSVVGSDYATDITQDCSCQAKIAEEENKIFANALAVSYVQDALPTIPHLTYREDEHDIVRMQDDNTPISIEYRMGSEWVKGEQIGLGALSSCFQARDVFTGTLMAAKQVNYVRCSNSEQNQVLDVIHKEIEMMRQLSHPNIVRLHGATKERGCFNIFFEWCAGGSVSTLLNKYGPFAETVTTNYALQVFRGLSYLHDHHIIHRDIKGANLLVDSTGQRIRIGDFGASARLASKGTAAGEFKGQLLGTIAFMAPEVLRGEHYGRSCDIWSTGCTIIEMTSGKPPWNADEHSNHLALIFKIASTKGAPDIPENLSPAMRDLCRRCFEYKPTDRPKASELLTHPAFIQW